MSIRRPLALCAALAAVAAAAPAAHAYDETENWLNATAARSSTSPRPTHDPDRAHQRREALVTATRTAGGCRTRGAQQTRRLAVERRPRPRLLRPPGRMDRPQDRARVHQRARPAARGDGVGAVARSSKIWDCGRRCRASSSPAASSRRSRCTTGSPRGWPTRATSCSPTTSTARAAREGNATGDPPATCARRSTSSSRRRTRCGGCSTATGSARPATRWAPAAQQVGSFGGVVKAISAQCRTCGRGVRLHRPVPLQGQGADYESFVFPPTPSPESDYDGKLARLRGHACARHRRPGGRDRERHAHGVVARDVGLHVVVVGAGRALVRPRPGSTATSPATSRAIDGSPPKQGGLTGTQRVTMNYSAVATTACRRSSARPTRSAVRPALTWWPARAAPSRLAGPHGRLASAARPGRSRRASLAASRRRSPSDARHPAHARPRRDVAQRDGAVALGEPGAVGAEHERHVGVAGSGQAERAGQPELARRRVDAGRRRGRPRSTPWSASSTTTARL